MSWQFDPARDHVADLPDSVQDSRMVHTAHPFAYEGLRGSWNFSEKPEHAVLTSKGDIGEAAFAHHIGDVDPMPPADLLFDLGDLT
jgi:hypothetical protein